MAVPVARASSPMRTGILPHGAGGYTLERGPGSRASRDRSGRRPGDADRSGGGGTVAPFGTDPGGVRPDGRARGRAHGGSGPEGAPRDPGPGMIGRRSDSSDRAGGAGALPGSGRSSGPPFEALRLRSPAGWDPGCRPGARVPDGVSPLPVEGGAQLRPPGPPEGTKAVAPEPRAPRSRPAAETSARCAGAQGRRSRVESAPAAGVGRHSAGHPRLPGRFPVPQVRGPPRRAGTGLAMGRSARADGSRGWVTAAGAAVGSASLAALLAFTGLLAPLERPAGDAVLRLATRLAPGGVIVIGPGEVMSWEHPRMERIRFAHTLAFRRRA